MKKKDSKSLLSFLGKTVNVIIDRKLGSEHPKYPKLIYQINYGFLPHTKSPDNEEIDVYVLGIKTAIEKLDDAFVVAIIQRKNDIEDKLVVIPPNLSYKNYSKDEILKIVNFQENFFEHKVVLYEPKIVDENLMECDLFYHYPLLDSILRRKSGRIYRQMELPKQRLDLVLNYCESLVVCEDKKNLKWEEDPEGFKFQHIRAKIRLPNMNGVSDFLAVIGKKSLFYSDFLKVGYLFEKVIIYATSLGIGTHICSGSFFTERIFELLVRKGLCNKNSEKVVMMTPMGVLKRPLCFVDEHMRKMSTSDTRKDSTLLFFEGDFETPLKIGKKYLPIFKAIRWSPSGFNLQTWRIVKEKGENVFHFYGKVEKTQWVNVTSSKHTVHIDVGIFMANWSIACEEMGIKGKFEDLEHGNFVKNLKEIPKSSFYVKSWVEST